MTPDQKEDRRREPRLSGSSASFVIKNLPKTEEPLNCKVVNLSRLGLGIEFSTEPPAHLFSVGSSVEGTLTVGKHSLEAKAAVRVRRGKFIGLEYAASTGAFMRALLKALTPGFIAQSIYRIAPEFLNPEVEYAYRGDEFECILFRASGERPRRTLQIFSGGSVVEISADSSRFVPGLLVRRPGDNSAFDMIPDLSAINSSTGALRLMRFFLWVQQILEQWPECPAEVRSLVAANLSRITHKNSE